MSVATSTCRARARRRWDLSSSRRASSAAANRRRNSALDESASTRVPRLGIDEHEMAGVGQLALARVDDLDREHVVRAGEAAERPRPLRTLRIRAVPGYR